jgi:hypothetical protein
MPSNLSADERAAVEKVRDALDRKDLSDKELVVFDDEPLYPGSLFKPGEPVTYGDLRTLLAVVARAGEAVAWVVEFKRNDENEWRKSGPHLDYAEAERDQTRLLLRQWPAHIIPLYAHPADARDRGDAGEAVSAAELAHMFAMGMTRNVAIDLSQPIRLTHDKVESAMRYVAHALKSRAAIDHAMTAAPAAPEGK